MPRISNAVGQPRLPIDIAFVRTVLELLAAGAKELQSKRTVMPRMREDNISQRLNEEMDLLHRGSESDIVNWGMRTARTVSGRPTDVFEVDFSFHANILPRDQRRYLAVEAKKLRGTGRSLAGDYVKQGVMRFVTGHYARGHNYAVILGYVVAAPIGTAVARVKSAMDRRAGETNQQVSFSPDNTICSHPYTYSSVHLRTTDTTTFTLVHLLTELC